MQKEAPTLTITLTRSFIAEDFFRDWKVEPNFARLFRYTVEETGGRRVAVDLHSLDGWLENGPILRKLGGIREVAISLQVFAAIAALGLSFVACVFDESGKPWAVFHRQEGAKHIVGADSIDYQYWWYGGGQFVSRHVSERAQKRRWQREVQAFISPPSIFA